MKIGYIGLGVIGQPMCGHLLEEYGELVVWNRTPSKAEKLLEAGATRAESPADLASKCDVICVCVSDTPDVKEVVLGSQGVAEGLGQGKLVIDFSTISAKATEELAARAESKGASWVDAPVSGGDVGARKGTLTIMAGGTSEDFQRALPIFETVGKKIAHMGPTGNGQRTKMANQIAVAGTIASMAEGLNFAREKGMDVKKVLEVISTGAAGSWSLSTYGPRLLEGDLAPGFAASLMAKDCRLVLEALEGLEGDYSVFEKMAEVYQEMERKGDGNLGNHAAAVYLGWETEKQDPPGH